MRFPWLTIVAVITGGLILAAACLIGLSTREPRIGGTFIGAIVTDDGIVVGSDSRSTFVDENGQSFGYVDGMQKIYVSGSNAVAVSGLASVEGELFNSFLDKNSFLMARSVDEVLFGLSTWLPFKNSTGVLLLSAGWSQGKATVCVRSIVQPQACHTDGFITNKASASLQAWLSAQHGPLKALSAAAALKQAILDSAAADITVGGPISLVQLRSGDSPIWLENEPGHNGWKTICDVVRDYRGGRVKIVATGAQADLDRHLVASCR